ncbi:histidine kinase [Salinigranum rubrum]|uniref:histidine kinase n=1 Tax=Salinigranum rubrum TaxID=755307 RepID=A0A2I8VI68_9EURY|nr:ATP-binding protein [Salinigranum rubrum]AUV81633.1 histidine kinase [Salinigranum rubrum]
MKLRTTFVVLLIVVTLVLSSLTYGGLELYKQETLQRNQASVDESAALAADQIATRVRERRDYIGYVASQPATANVSKSGTTIGGVVNNSRFFAAQVVAANGTVVAFGGQIDESVRRETIGSDVSDEAYFVEATRRSSYVSAPEAVPGRDRYLVVVSAPIITDDGLQGVFAASMYVSTDTLLGPVATLDTRRQRVTVTASDTVLFDSDERFEQVLTGTARVDGVGWQLTVERDRSQLNAQLQTLAVAQGVGLLLVLLSVVSFWVWESRMNLRQTDRLLEGFSSLLDGQHGHSLDLSASEEWIQIGEGFNELSAGLAAREAAVHEREERLSVLNRILRHNLRNDMNVILGYADLIEERADGELVASAAATIQTTGGDLVDLGEKARWIDEGLDDTATERGELDVASLVERVVADVGASYPETTVTTDLPPGSAATAFAAPAVEEAVRNLVENACEHNDTAAPCVEVSVSARTAGETDGGDAPLDTDGPDSRVSGEVRIVVRDNGPGISDYELEAVTEGHETALEHGSGVGLWLSRWLVEHSGGRLDFADNEPRGTVVTVSLPRAADGS